MCDPLIGGTAFYRQALSMCLNFPAREAMARLRVISPSAASARHRLNIGAAITSMIEEHSVMTMPRGMPIRVVPSGLFHV